MNAVMFCNRNSSFQIYINIITILNPCIIDQNIYLSDFRIGISQEIYYFRNGVHKGKESTNELCNFA